MANSMTGFARVEAPLLDTDNSSLGSLTWEMRSVNHRYLETHFRLPDDLRELETQLRQLLRQSLARGKLDVALQLHLDTDNKNTLAINTALVTQISHAIGQIEEQLPHAASISALDLLKWPGVLQKQGIERAQLLQQSLAAFDTCIPQLIDHRAREGAELARLIEQRLIAMDKHIINVRAAMPKILQAQRDKLINKVAELQLELDPERLEQETVLLAQKADIDEELDRLDTHILEVRRTLNQSGSIGRRLDFLMQELNREANTLSSKSIVSETTLAAVELKVLIEQMREQIQNIE